MATFCELWKKTRGLAEKMGLNPEFRMPRNCPNDCDGTSCRILGEADPAHLSPTPEGQAQNAAVQQLELGLAVEAIQTATNA